MTGPEYPNDHSTIRVATTFDLSDTSPAGRLSRALADAGGAIEDMEPGSRHAAVRTFLDAQGWMPDSDLAFEFLVGVFIHAHWLRLSCDGLYDELAAGREAQDKLAAAQAHALTGEATSAQGAS